MRLPALAFALATAFALCAPAGADVITDWGSVKPPPVPVLAPGTGKTKTGRLWVYVRDERPHGGQRAPAAVFFYSPDRKGERPQEHLKRFRGVLHADGYAGFNAIFEKGTIVEAACWAHVRRKFFDVHAANSSPIAVRSAISSCRKVKAASPANSASRACLSETL